LEKKILIIGYGNVYCRDDGVAFYIINELRRLEGIPALQPDEDGLEELGHGLDSVMLHQLVPEIVPLVSNYQSVFFVDAHVADFPEEVRIVQVQEELRFHAVTHHMSPGMILSLVRQSNGVAPTGYLVSVKGQDFDFGFGLSDSCRHCADIAIQNILDLVHDLPCNETALR
jgi:hydrogenase maturation protease